MAKLPKSIIKKYGINKKAWQVFRGQKSSIPKRSSYKKNKTKVQPMARKRYFKKARKAFKKGFSLGNVLKILAGAAIAAAWEIFISPMIPLGATIKNIIELAIGVILMMIPRAPMIVKATGAAMATINAYALIYPLISGLGSGTSSTDF
jgi:hypothetical protein